ncbi:ABC transporter substrate-binding protein [Paenibacillus lentus]|uniref:ABC transporter substrate-binding protein n=1 Tax=Paenibacillus lentus TaxID=1338368 RepID=UPI003661F2F0
MSMRRGLFMILLLIFTINALAGCQRPQQNQPITLKVSYPSAQQFYKMFGYAFQKSYPHIEIQVLQDELRTEGNSFDTEADVIYLNGMYQYKAAIEQGKLRQIVPPLLNPSTNNGELSPVVTTLLSSASQDGRYYALAPTFHSEALYFNKKLFDKYNVPYPYDGMSWADIFTLAQRFPTVDEEGNRLYGIQMNYYQNVTMNYILKAGETENLSYFNPDTMKVTMNTERWKSIWSTAVQAFRAGVVYDQAEGLDSMKHPAFLTEDAAMTVSSNTLAYNFEPFSHFEGATRIDWGVVSPPVDPLSPDTSNFYEIFDYFGVSSASEHPEEALDLVKFITGDSLNSPMLAQKQPNFGLPAVIEYVHPVSEHDLSPLYSLKANPDYIDLYTRVEPDILDAFQLTAQSVLDRLLRDELTLEEALVEVELRGQEAVDAAIIELELKRQGK